MVTVGVDAAAVAAIAGSAPLAQNDRKFTIVTCNTFVFHEQNKEQQKKNNAT